MKLLSKIYRDFVRLQFLNAILPSSYQDRHAPLALGMPVWFSAAKLVKVKMLVKSKNVITAKVF